MTSWQGRQWFLCLFAVLGGPALADTIAFTGAITQSVSDGTGPAANNPGLNDIQTGDPYTVTISFLGSIGAPGFYDLTGASLVFNDSSASRSESSFGSIVLTIAANGLFDDLSLLACLTNGGACEIGNQLDANFRILATGLNSQNVTATGLDEPHPLDLLEDDGVTDIHGSITTYSYRKAASAVPEPSTLGLIGIVLVMGSFLKRKGVSECEK